MFNPWLAFGLKAAQIGVEAQNVIALRMLRLVFGGGHRVAVAEATRMVTEKVAAASEAQAVSAMAIARGQSQHVVATKALGVLRKRVRANRRWLSRS